MSDHSVPIAPAPQQTRACLDLQGILQGAHDAQTFLESFWLQRPWFSEASRERLELAEAVLESTDLGFLLSRCADFSVRVPRVSSGQPKRKAEFQARRWPQPRKISIESALDAHEREGATIYGHLAGHPAQIPVPSLAYPRESLGDCGLPRLLESARQLARDLGVPVVLASFFAVRGAQGTAAHVDLNENFTIQLKGSKRWRVCNERSVVNPGNQRRLGAGQARTSSTSSNRAWRDGETTEFVLTPGAVLYVPREFIHEVMPEEPDADNLALNLCIRPQQWLMVLTEILREAAAEDPLLREGIYTAGGTTSDEAFLNRCRMQLRRLTDVLQTVEPEHVSNFLLNTFEYSK